MSSTSPPAPPNPPSSPLPQSTAAAQAAVSSSMAMVNMNNLLNGKDSRWLQLEVCREFQRNKCTRPDTECKFAHPPANVEVQNGRVTACYDSIKVRRQHSRMSQYNSKQLRHALYHPPCSDAVTSRLLLHLRFVFSHLCEFDRRCVGTWQC